MKSLIFILALFALTGCDPYKFGFKKNPAYVLDEAFKSITNLDTQSFMEVADKEFFCSYGNNQGVNFLKENLSLKQETLKFEPKVLDTEHYNIPRYVGYWSYYHERYQIDIQDKETNESLLRAIIDCDYGTDGQKNEKFINLKPKKYKTKECKIVKIVPKTFNNLPLEKKCMLLQVSL